jgi:uncharacterized protein (TIGR03790 family)
MLSRMRLFALLALGLAGSSWVLQAAITPAQVAVLYNSAVPESRKLAEIYRSARGIPEGNLIGLEMSAQPDISRQDYEKKILNPLRNEFETRAWWQRKRQPDGVTLPVANKIRVLVTMRGVPLRIQPQPKPTPKPGDPPSPNPTVGHDEAAVDSELAMLGVESLPLDSLLQNKFYQSSKSISDAGLPFLMLTARIDAPTFTTCERMIRDAVAAEKTGLWGWAHVDIANKIPQGDQWLETVVKENAQVGIPTAVDRYNDTLPKNYPITDASLYYGWYDPHVSGPFLNNRFIFRPGAVAMHLHSFSAEQLTDPSKNWSGALLEKGATVTVGNVYEPYLQFTHDFGILHQRLLAGFTWVEACWMAMPAASWQGVVLGDPLYRPFKHLAGSGEQQPADNDFRALRAAAMQWKNDPLERQKQLKKASERMASAVLAEAVALELLELKDSPQAVQWFQIAKGHSTKTEDKLRQDLAIISIDRATGRKDMAIAGLQKALLLYGSLPEGDAVRGWLEILKPVVVTPPAK